MVKVKKNSNTRRYKREFSKLCKKIDAKRPNRDALEIAEGLYNQFLKDLVNRMDNLSGSGKTITHKTAQMAFISLMSEAGMSDDFIASGLTYTDTARKFLNE